MIEIKKKERTGAIGVSIKENNRDANAKIEQKQKRTFSLFGKKSSIEELKKKVGPTISLPITADSKAVEDFHAELIERYAVKSGRDVSNILFYYLFGLYKNAVIAQQIYARWKQGHTKDARFGALLPIIKGLGAKAEFALESGKI